MSRRRTDKMHAPCFQLWPTEVSVPKSQHETVGQGEMPSPQGTLIKEIEEENRPVDPEESVRVGYIDGLLRDNLSVVGFELLLNLRLELPTLTQSYYVACDYVIIPERIPTLACQISRSRSALQVSNTW